MMEAFIKKLLKESGVHSSNVTVVDDNACPQLSTTSIISNRSASSSVLNSGPRSNATNSSNHDRPCRWSNITEDMKDLRIAKSILSDLRRRSLGLSVSRPSTGSHDSSISNMQHVSAFNGHVKMTPISGKNNEVSESRAISSIDNERLGPSFLSNDNDSPANQSNSGWDDKQLWNDVSSLCVKSGVGREINKLRKKIGRRYVRSNCHHDDIDDQHMSAEEESEEIESDSDDTNEESIDIIEYIQEGRAFQEGMQSNGSLERFPTSIISTSKEKGLGSSTDITDTTYEMDSSYQSILECNKLVSGHQAPRLPQRKISQEKLHSLTSFLSSSLSSEGISASNNRSKSNAAFNVIPTAPNQKQWWAERHAPSGTVPMIRSSSQILGAGSKQAERQRRKKGTCGSSIVDDSSNKEKSRLRHCGARSRDRDLTRFKRAERLRNALGPMAPLFGTKSGNAVCPSRSRRALHRSQLNANEKVIEISEEQLYPPLPPPRTTRLRGGRKRTGEITGGDMIAALVDRNKITTVSAIPSPPTYSINDSPCSPNSVNCAKTVKGSQT